MSTPIVNTYDQVPYDKKSFSQTHVDNLATTATLFGMQPARPECCRVLELGCAAGANLIPMAFYLPESQFMGVDYSKVQIDDGQKVLQSLRLANIELKQLNILEIDKTLGQFDYIICHGIFSWVADEIQEKIFSICSQNLAPQGVAYVSYKSLV